MTEVDLSDAEIERYARQLVMPGLGGDGQMRLKRAGALVVGAGALGTAAAGYLAGAGVGRIGIVDPDTVDLTNMQRQLLYLPSEIGLNKAHCASQRLGRLNTEVLVEPYPVRIEEANAEALVAGRDVVLDCSDTFETRYFVNEICMAAGVPLVEAGVLGMDGIVMTIKPGRTACYRCAFPEPPKPGTMPSCAEAGLLGPIGGVIGSLQAVEAIKLIAELGRPLTDRVLQVEGRDLTFTSVSVRRRPGCEACGAVGAGRA